MDKEQIILVTPYRNSFINNDIEILSKQYEIVLNNYNWKRKSLYPIFAIRQLFFLLANIRKTNKIVIEFGGYWSVLPTLIGKIFNTPTAIILHGTDSAIINHIKYGSMRKRLVKKVCEFSYKRASILLPVSNSLIYTKSNYTENENIQGIKHYFPNLETPIRVIHNGLNHLFWNSIKSIEKEQNSFITVLSETQFIRKGGDLIVSIAKEFPHCNFYIAGSDKIEHTSIPENIFFLGKLTQEELKVAYNKSKFYLQLSIFEGFGLSLCEAMLCNCIPIVSSVNILPEIIGNSGFTVLKKEIHEVKKVITNAIESPNQDELQKLARKRIVDNFSIEKRDVELIDTLENL